LREDGNDDGDDDDDDEEASEGLVSIKQSIKRIIASI
jgi:hypothetical protein